LCMSSGSHSSLRWVVLRINLAQTPFIIKNEGKWLTSTYRLLCLSLGVRPAKSELCMYSGTMSQDYTGQRYSYPLVTSSYTFSCIYANNQDAHYDPPLHPRSFIRFQSCRLARCIMLLVRYSSRHGYLHPSTSILVLIHRAFQRSLHCFHLHSKYCKVGSISRHSLRA
jgi:hypothetical protein